jgi:5-amino-6-(5-phospho-D-ribitylamino)uracil phosphatase
MKREYMMENNHAPEINLIALDMDGTLLNGKDEVSEENRKAIKEAKDQGIEVVLSTGRSRLTSWEHAESLELNSYLINVNGSEIWGPNGELIERILIDADMVQWMWNLAQTYKTKYYATSCEKYWRNEMSEKISDYEWLKFGFDTEDATIRETILKDLKAKGNLEISNSSLTNIEVNAIGINKAKGIQKVCGLLGISMENVMAIGDSLNDLSMIKECGLGVAMGNAQDIVKEVADDVTDSNINDGVAKAIQKWIL